MRPLGIAALEDKIVQRAVVEVLNAVLRRISGTFPMGFGRNVARMTRWTRWRWGLNGREVNWVLDADIRDFFNQLDRGWLERFLRHRIADERLLRLVGKWLTAGVVEEGVLGARERAHHKGHRFRRCWLTCTCSASRELVVDRVND